jgi:SAM-dependent methyltransferase
MTARDRSAWLAERRRAVEQDYTRDGPTYDDGYDPVTPVHRRFVASLIDRTPAGGAVLDAACGTGPYIGLLLDAGLTVVGADQSAGMLARAKRKHPSATFVRTGLQELPFDGEFDAAMCVDAIEHVPPEEWPLVVGNLRRALRPAGHLYLTVEEVAPEDLERAYVEGSRAGAPIVHGEDVGDGTGGYHHYPPRDRVHAWLRDAGFAVADDADEWLGGYGYHHLLLATHGATRGA